MTITKAIIETLDKRLRDLETEIKLQKFDSQKIIECDEALSTINTETVNGEVEAKDGEVQAKDTEINKKKSEIEKTDAKQKAKQAHKKTPGHFAAK